MRTNPAKRRVTCARTGNHVFDCRSNVIWAGETAARAGVSEHQGRGGSGQRRPASAGWLGRQQTHEHVPIIAWKPQPRTAHRPAPDLERSGGPYRSPRPRRALHAGLIGAAVLVGLAALPGASSAGLAPAEQASSDGLEVRRLAEVRERLERRRALQRSLQAQIDGLAATIEDLRARHEKTSDALGSEREKASELEQRLDRLVPRFLARVAEVRERRAQAARALADLAGKSQSLRLDPRLRARMLVLSPLMLKRLRDGQHGLEVLREGPDEAIERHARIEQSLPALMGVRRRLRRQTEESGELRQAALDRLRGLQTEVRLLGQQEERLAGEYQRDETAAVARAQARTDRGALPDRVATPGAFAPSAVHGLSALVAGVRLDSNARVAHVADAWNRAGARVVAEAPKPNTGHGSTELVADRAAPTDLPSPAMALTATARSQSQPARPRASHDAVDRATTLDVVFLPDGSLSPQSGRRARGRRETSPILPVAKATRGQSTVALGRPDLAIRAMPGQAVAAPVEGRVVFAGRFKSYGLLLILEHEREYHTLLWGFARLYVERDDQVRVGQIVGIMDARGGDPPVLHVERRRNGRPIDLAASSNGIQG